MKHLLSSLMRRILHSAFIITGMIVLIIVLAADVLLGVYLFNHLFLSDWGSGSMQELAGLVLYLGFNAWLVDQIDQREHEL